MQYFLLLAGFTLASAAQAAGFGGIYIVENPQVRILAKLESSGERLVGIVEVGGRVRINLVGAIQGNLARGSATSQDGAGAFEAQVEGDTLGITIAQPEDRNHRAARLSLVLQRSDLSTAEPAEAIRDWLITAVSRLSESAMMLRLFVQSIRCSAGTDPSCTQEAGRPPAAAGRSTGAIVSSANKAYRVRSMAHARSGSSASAALE